MTRRLRIIGKVVGAVGLKGDIRVHPTVFDFETVIRAGSVYVGYESSAARDIEVTPVSRKGNTFRYRVQGVSSREVSEALVGQFFFAPLKPGEFLPEEIIGFDVVSTEGNLIGDLVDVLHMPAGDVYVIDRAGREVLIPAVGEIVKKVNREQEEVTIFPMEGLLD
ncbi:MAG: ribosome maturation factor RimM [Fidelibacterota bacterium]